MRHVLSAAVVSALLWSCSDKCKFGESRCNADKLEVCMEGAWRSFMDCYDVLPIFDEVLVFHCYECPGTTASCGTSQVDACSECTPGAKDYCLCSPGGQLGEQTCASDGSGYGDCLCCTAPQIACGNKCTSCGTGTTPYCEAGKAYCCGAAATFCATTVSGCTNCYNAANVNCDSIASCNDGKCHACLAYGYHFDCTSQQCVHD